MPPRTRTAPPKKRTRAEIDADLKRLQAEEAEDDDDDQGDDDDIEIWEYRTHKKTGAEYRVRHAGKAGRAYLESDADESGGGDQGDADESGDSDRSDSVWGRRKR